MSYTMSVFWADMEKFTKRGAEITDAIELPYGEVIYTMYNQRLVYTTLTYTSRIVIHDLSVGPTEEEYVACFTMKLNKHMKRNHMNAPMLSEVTGISKRTIIRYTHGESCPSLGNMHKIAKALQLKVSDLLYPGF